MSTLEEKRETATLKEISIATEHLLRCEAILNSEFKSTGIIYETCDYKRTQLYWETIGYIEGKCNDDIYYYADTSKVCDFIMAYLKTMLDNYIFK